MCVNMCVCVECDYCTEKQILTTAWAKGEVRVALGQESTMAICGQGWVKGCNGEQHTKKQNAA